MNNYEFDLLSSKLAVRCSKEIFMPYPLLNKIISTAPYRYKRYSIPKKSDPTKRRQIAHPAKELKIIQRWLLKEILCKFAVHECAQAYKKKCSIKSNAEKHVKNKYILKMDFKDFFPSITSNDFFNTISGKLKLNEYDKYFLQQVLFCKDKLKIIDGYYLSIGAPTSPILSNIIMFDFDEKLSSYCKKNSIVYTRYADDLTFSTKSPNLLKNCQIFVENLCDTLDSPNLSVNHKKTVHASTNMRRRVTGLILSNQGKVSLGRDRKRTIKAALHNYKQGKQSQDQINRLSGLLAFSKDVEPEFFDKLHLKYPEEIHLLIGLPLLRDE